MSGLEWAIQWNFRQVCIRSDSLGVIQIFTSGSIPWVLRNRWMAIRAGYDSEAVLSDTRCSVGCVLYTLDILILIKDSRKAAGNLLKAPAS